MEQDYSSTNLNLGWLELILQQLKAIQSMQRLASEGCNELVEYLSIPLEYRGIVLPEAQYKNFRLLALEISMILDNLPTVISDDKIREYKEKIKPIMEHLDDRKLFLKERYQDGRIISIETQPLLRKGIQLITEIKAGLTKELAPLLYIKDDNKKTW